MATDSQPPKRDVTATMGQLIDGRYRISAFIGDGGMGSVYRAEHVTIRKPVAVKLLHREFATQPGFADRFEREALAAGRLDHPNCVEVSDFGRLPDGTLYLVMELIEGKPLSDLLHSHGRLPVPRALHIARHVLRALGHAHAAGIVHRDVKPDNIVLIDHDGDRDFVKLLDFGIAKLIGEAAAEVKDSQLTQVGTTVGTPKYMPPEQAFGKSVDHRADLYALSVVLYMMLTGRPPFDADEVIDILMQHASKAPPPFAEVVPDSDIPAEVEELVMRGLAKKREHRYEDADAYLAALEAALDAYHQRPRASPTTSPTAAPAPAPAAAATPAPGRALAPGSATRQHTGVNPATFIALPPLTMLWRRRPVWQWAGLAGGLLIIIILIATAKGDGPVEPPAKLQGAIDLFAKAKTLTGRAPSEQARKAEALVKKGEFRAALELTTGTDLDGFARLQRGHALAGLNRMEEALGQYRLALAEVPALRDDPIVRAHAREQLAAAHEKTALAAAELLSRYGSDESGKTRLLEMAGEEKDMEVRKRARAIAQELGLGDEINMVRSLALDLAQEKTCEERRKALLELEDLGDARSLDAVKKARYRMRGGVLGVGQKNTNRCLKDDAERIVKSLESK